jgi:hypothetical protein
VPHEDWRTHVHRCVKTLPAQFIIICRWLQLIHKDRLAPLENAPFSTLWARKRYRVAQRFHQLSLSRLNHWLPRGQAHPEVVQGTAEFHHQITDLLLPQADPVLHDAAALDTTIDMLDP